MLEQPGGQKTVLRVHRPGYHSLTAINSELAWMAALRNETGLVTPMALPGNDGALVQSVDAGKGEMRFAVLFAFEEGTEPEQGASLVASFRQLGVLAANCHAHAERWALPEGFTRLTWDADTILSPDAHWGDWRDGPGVRGEIPEVLSRGEKAIRAKLSGYGKGADRFGIIHADMRLANLLVDDGQTKLIDFDDCGFGWFAYDFAAAISFFEDSELVPDLLAGWLAGYKTVRGFSEADLGIMDTMVLLRRYALLAWIGSHHETELAANLKDSFAAGTAGLAERYLSDGKIVR
ncbi:MAG TPA: aminoglycoside phosphotransferase [Devosia sp.]|nr:aminoglycoside phosphotransferase [Devosia sp.]